MWQRVQTLYIGIATLLIASLFWCDVAKMAGVAGVEHVLYTEKTIYLIWLIILTFLQVMSLLGFKWRMKQLRVTIVTAFMCLGFQGWLAFDYFTNNTAMVYSWTALFPAVAAILDFIGARNIMLDEAIVQSASRLRSARKKRK